jgi:leucyl aminopeptidase
MKKILALTALCAFSPSAFATEPVLASLRMLEKTGLPVEAKDAAADLGFARLTSAQQGKLVAAMHEEGKCGGFELLPSGPGASSGKEIIARLAARVRKDEARPLREVKIAKKPEIVAALGEVKEENIRSTVEWLSSYPSRSNRLPEPNAHVRDMEAKVRELLSAYPGMWSVTQIAHQRTRQNSLRVHLEGKSRAKEIVVLGGHLDSINQGWGGGQDAPGADDNASGSASLLEALRVLASRGVPERSVEFFWYAGEESGLLGSAEIAQSYKAENKDVVAVLQLDMTLFPGAGEFVVGNVSDFTSAWLRQYLVALNDAYLQVQLIEDKCGYACSDHASWYRQGYPTLMPFESDTSRMNRKIHTDQDVISPQSSFRHSLVFAKIALAMAMDLGNSAERQP